MYAAGSETAADISVLFEKYRLTGDKALRNEIVMQSIHIVRYAVISTRNMFRRYTDDDDISNEAVLALMAAAESYDPKKNVKFDTYASIKVRGAIIDYIRKMDNVPRSVRKFAREYDRAFSDLYASLDREPTREELAKKLGITVEKLDNFSARSAASQTLSFEELLFGGFETAAESGEFNEAESRLMLTERRDQLAAAIRELKEKERTVITLYYYEKLKYSEIAQVLDISESRVCQIHAKAVEKLRESLSEYMDK